MFAEIWDGFGADDARAWNWGQRFETEYLASCEREESQRQAREGKWRERARESQASARGKERARGKEGRRSARAVGAGEAAAGAADLEETTGVLPTLFLRFRRTLNRAKTSSREEETISLFCSLSPY